MPRGLLEKLGSGIVPALTQVLLGFWAGVLLPAALLCSSLPMASGPPALQGAV